MINTELFYQKWYFGEKINFGTPLNKPCLINLYLTTLSLLIAVPKHLQGGCIAI